MGLLAVPVSTVYFSSSGSQQMEYYSEIFHLSLNWMYPCNITVEKSFHEKLYLEFELPVNHLAFILNESNKPYGNLEDAGDNTCVDSGARWTYELGISKYNSCFLQ
jgi:hypothetical protein